MHTRSFSILYIDDDENDIHLLEFGAEAAGISDCLRTVSSGPQAMDYFQGHGQYADRSRFPLPHLVLLDLRMPRMNGLEVLRWLRSNPEWRGVVVVVFTASAYPDDISSACELGANAFVQKPSTHAELVRFLKLVQEFWGEFHQFPDQRHHALPAEMSGPKLAP